MTRPLHHHVVSLMLLSASLSAVAQTDQASSSQPVTVAVQSFAITGNTLLPDEQLRAVLQPFVGTRSLEELKQAALAVQTAYREAGYGAVAAFVPEQSPADGRFEIRVVEGKLTRIEVEGERQFTEAGIRASLPALQPGLTPRVSELDRQIRLANENPARKLGVLLGPGEAPGDVQATISVSEQPVGSWFATLDSTGNASTGQLRAGLGYRHAALWDLDHVLAVHVQTSPEQPSDVAVGSLNYRVPFYAQSLALDAYAAYSDVDGSASTNAGPAQIAGRGRIVGLRVSSFLPRIGEFDQRLMVSLDSRDYLNNCSIVGLPPGACGSAGESVSVQPLSIDYLLRKGGPMSIGGSVGLVRNLHLGGSHGGTAQFDRVRPGASRSYSLIRAGVSAAFSTFEDRWQVQMRLNGQHTDDPLVPGEQFGLGGALTVRGYEERELAGDRGAAGSVELVSPDLLAGAFGKDSSLRALGFVDFGWVGNLRDTPCEIGRDQCSIASFGLGVRFTFERLQYRLDVAHALEPSNRTGRHDTRVHFALLYSF